MRCEVLAKARNGHGGVYIEVRGVVGGVAVCKLLLKLWWGGKRRCRSNAVIPMRYNARWRNLGETRRISGNLWHLM